MSSERDKPIFRSAAWRISLWGTLAFAIGTVIVFISLHEFLANDIRRRSDAWISGEVGVLGNVIERTPKSALYGQVVSEFVELIRKEIPNAARRNASFNDSVFFLQMGENGSPELWVGDGDGQSTLNAIRQTRMTPGLPGDLQVSGIAVPFRVVSIRVADGSRIYLGYSERDELRVLSNLRLRFTFLWLVIVLLGYALVFFTTRSMLSRVQQITEVASRIGRSGLNRRVPATTRNDEVAILAQTLNSMLDRIASSIHQLHTITGSLAHDLRSPLTAIRGRLEMSLSAAPLGKQAEVVAAAVEELDRLTDFLTQSLDVSEAKADALRLSRSEIDLDQLLKAMTDVYRPSMDDKGLRVALQSSGPVKIDADAALVHRMIGNLFDNEVKHLPAACTVTILLRAAGDWASLILEDDGPGFPPEVYPHLFERSVKGRDSNGHGLGLAFIDAAVRAHGGAVTASNRETGGARIAITLPLASNGHAGSTAQPAYDSALIPC